VLVGPHTVVMDKAAAVMGKAAVACEGVVVDTVVVTVAGTVADMLAVHTGVAYTGWAYLLAVGVEHNPGEQGLSVPGHMMGEHQEHIDFALELWDTQMAEVVFDL